VKLFFSGGPKNPFLKKKKKKKPFFGG